MADVTITTDTVSLFSHEVYFELILEDTASASYDARLLDMGSLSYEFDIPNSGEDATAIGVKSGAIDIEIEDYLVDSSTLLSTVIESAYQHASKPLYWRGAMYFRLKGNAFGNPVPFKFDTNDVKISEMDRTVKLSLNPYQAPSVSDPSLAFNLSTTFGFINQYRAVTFPTDYTLTYSPSGDETDSRAMLAGEFIRAALFRAFNYEGILDSWPPDPNEEPIFQSNVFRKGDVGSDSPSSGTEWFVVQNTKNIEGSNTNNLINTIQQIGILASLEGAIFGHALGKGFYVNRRDTSNQVTLDWDNVVNPEKVFFYDGQYASIYLEHNGESAEEFSNSFGKEKNLNIVFGQSGIYRAEINTTSTCTETTFTDEIVQEGILVYPKTFGFDGETSLKVKYWGFENIYPYSVINFDSKAPSFYQNKNYRVKVAKYDFKLDIVELELYEI